MTWVRGSPRGESVWMQKKIGLTALAAVAFLSGSGVRWEAAPKSRTYLIYLSNNFAANDWRQQMLRTARIIAKMPPLAGRVDLKIENVETTVQAQINSLNNIVRIGPDAILIDAGSRTALNPTIEKACKAGILVIAFDQITTAPCAFGMESDWTRMATVAAEWIVREIGGRGKVLVDRGLAGAPVSAELLSGYELTLAKYPGIRIVGYFNGDYALGARTGRSRGFTCRAPGCGCHSLARIRRRSYQGVRGRGA